MLSELQKWIKNYSIKRGNESDDAANERIRHFFRDGNEVGRGRLLQGVKDATNEKAYQEYLKVCRDPDLKQNTLYILANAFETLPSDLTKEDVKNFIFYASVQLLWARFGPALQLPTLIPKELKLGLGSEHLSSGQRHYQSLLFQLLMAQNSSLLLIDEPEISLHLEWQRGLIDTLNLVRKSLSKRPQGLDYVHFPIIITTHSPDIIYHHPELVVSIPPVVEE
jgi:hypothetical protein